MIDQSLLILIFGLGFALFFVAMWLFVLRILALFGWSKFLPAFAWDHPIAPDARHYSWASMVIGRFPGGISYRNAMDVWIDQRGVYLRPAFLMKLFHPTLHFGWDTIASVKPRKTLWVKAGQISFHRDVPMLTFGGKAGQAIIEVWQVRGGGNGKR